LDIRLATCGVALLLAGGCASTASAPTTTPLPSASADPWVALEARPLALPTVAPGDCPTAAGRQVTWPGPNLTPAETWTLGHRNTYGLAFDSAAEFFKAHKNVFDRCTAMGVSDLAMYCNG